MRASHSRPGRASVAFRAALTTSVFELRVLAFPPGQRRSASRRSVKHRAVWSIEYIVMGNDVPIFTLPFLFLLFLFDICPDSEINIVAEPRFGTIRFDTTQNVSRIVYFLDK